MHWLQIILLGIIQGITEFLPVSSSGHLVVVQKLFSALGKTAWPDIMSVNVLLHTGTLASIIVFYWRRIINLLQQDRRVLGLLAVGTVPAAAFGLLLKKMAPAWLESPLLAGFMFLATGSILLYSGRREGALDYREITWRCALVIGIFQAFAILPGLSRSGWTIAGAMLLGLKREAATTFSFLLAIPVILGATILEAGDLFQSNGEIPFTLLLLGAGVAFFVGLFALWLLVRIVERGQLGWFAVWLFPLGVAVIAWQCIG